MEANENNVRQSGTRIKVKTLKGMVPNYLTQLFNICNNDDYQLRSNNLKIYLPKPKTHFLKSSFSYRGAVSWIKIQLAILQEFNECQSVVSFRRLLCNYLENL